MMETNNFEELELKKVQHYCNRFGYRAFLRFGEIHIRTNFESWYFIPNENGTIRLMHGNCVGHCNDTWHRQFKREQMEYKDLIRYIHEHERAKYSKRFVRFHYTKFGTPKRAIS